MKRLALWAAPPLRNAPYALVAALMFVRFADEWTTYLPAGALEPIRRELSLSYVQAGGVFVALSAGGILGNGFTLAADYVSRRWLAAAGALAYGAALIAFGLSHAIVVMIAAAFVWGAASDAFVHGCEVALVDLAGEGLPRALSRLNAWAAVGDFLGPVTLALAATLGFGWRGAFLGCGVMMFGYAALLASQRFPPPHPREHLPHPFAGLLAIFADRRVLLLAAAMGLFSLLDEPLAAFLIAYLERVRGESAAGANIVVLAWVAGQVAALAVYERLVAGRSVRRILLTSAIIFGAALPATIFSPALWQQALASGVFGGGAAIFYATLQARILGLRPGQAGSVSAVVSIVGDIGMVFPLLVGACADAFGLTAGLGLYVVIPALILVLLARDRA